MRIHNGDVLASRISLILYDYDKRPRIAKKLNILEYWERQKLHSELFELSQVVLAVPVTQVSVEWVFWVKICVILSARQHFKGKSRRRVTRAASRDLFPVNCFSKSFFEKLCSPSAIVTGKVRRMYRAIATFGRQKWCVSQGQKTTQGDTRPKLTIGKFLYRNCDSLRQCGNFFA
jgi:hAT family C-terminal dimerisation region